ARAASRGDGARHPRDHLRAHRARHGFPGAVREALRKRALRRRPPARVAAGNALGPRYQPVPHRRAPPDGRRDSRRAGCRGQPREGRGRPGGAEHERDVRLPRDARTRPARGGSMMRSITRRLRSSFGIGSGRMTIRSQRAWYWRWLVNVLMMAAVGGVVWWLVQNSYRITGFDIEEVRHQIGTLTQENRAMKTDLDSARASLVERERQLQIAKAAQGELARTVAQLQADD